MKLLTRLFLIIAIVFWPLIGHSGMPNQLRSARMTDSTLASTIDNHVGDLETAITDILGIPIDTNISAALFDVTSSGLTRINFVSVADGTPNGGELWLSSTTANTLKYYDSATTRSLVDLSLTQTLTNKTLTAPVLSGTATGTYTLGGTPTITAPVLSGTITGTYTLGGTPTLGAALAMSGAPNLGTAVAPAGTGFFTLLDLEPTTSSTGIIRWNGANLIHLYGTNSIFIGPNAGNFTFTGAGSHIGIGLDALSLVTSGVENIAIGNLALSKATTGRWNTIVGIEGGRNLLSGQQNTGVGYSVLSGLTTGLRNVAIGYSSMAGAGETDDNVAVGYQALGGVGSYTAYRNVAVGASAMESSGSGSQNTAVGNQALRNLTSGIENVAIGHQAMVTGTTASHNVAVGTDALTSLTTAGINDGNVAIGMYAGALVTTSTGLVLVGYRSGRGTIGDDTNAVTTGTSLTYIGGFSGQSTATQLTNATAIGYQAKVGADNTMVLGGTGSYAVRVAVGATTAATSALVDLTSTTGALLVPRMTGTQRDALTPINGMIIYNSTTNQMEGYINSGWAAM